MTTTNTQTPKVRYADEVQVGDELPKLVKTPVTLNQLVRYSGASGDFNPLHTDPKVGELIGTGGVIAHGMLVMGFVGQLVSEYVGPAALRKFTVRFKGMTHLDDIVTCTGVITDKSEAEGETQITGRVQAIDQNGDVKVAGTFIAALAKR